jgi:hypothetical protein
MKVELEETWYGGHHVTKDGEWRGNVIPYEGKEGKWYVEYPSGDSRGQFRTQQEAIDHLTGTE